MNVTFSAHNATVIGTAQSSVKGVRYGKSPTAQGVAMRRYVIRELCGMGCVLWLVGLIPFGIGVAAALSDHEPVAYFWGAIYLFAGALLFKGQYTSPKVFLSRIERLKREGFRPELELQGRDDYVAFSRRQDKVVFLKWFDDKRIEMALSDIDSVKVHQENKRTYLQVYTRRLDMPRIGLRVPDGLLDDWLARLNIILNERAVA